MVSEDGRLGRGCAILRDMGRSTLIIGLQMVTLLGWMAGCRSAKPVGTGVAQFSADAYVPKAPPTPYEQAGASPAKAAHADNYRPATHTDNARAQVWLDTVASRNRLLTLTAGYRLQLYTGPDRAEAMKTKEAAYKHLAGAQVYLNYKAPDFKVKAGDYTSRLEAQLAERRARTYFPDVLVLPEQVNLR